MVQWRHLQANKNKLPALLVAERQAVSAVSKNRDASLPLVMSHNLKRQNVWNAKSECVGFFNFLNTQWGKPQVSLHLLFVDRLVTKTYRLFTVTTQSFFKAGNFKVAHTAMSGTLDRISWR